MTRLPASQRCRGCWMPALHPAPRDDGSWWGVCGNCFQVLETVRSEPHIPKVHRADPEWGLTVADWFTRYDDGTIDEYELIDAFRRLFPVPRRGRVSA